MRNLWRSSGIVGLAVLACTAVALPAQAPAVGPKQYFTGVINGTNGKTTVTALATAMLVGSGIAASAVGNIGEAFITATDPGAAVKSFALVPSGQRA